MTPKIYPYGPVGKAQPAKVHSLYNPTLLTLLRPSVNLHEVSCTPFQVDPRKLSRTDKLLN